MKFGGRPVAYGSIGVAVAAWVAYALVPAPLPVEVVRVERGELRDTVDEDGEVRAHDRYVIAAPVAGMLMRTALREGDSVERDQVVTRIAPIPLSERERQEQSAKVAAQEALLEEAREGVRRAGTSLRQAQRERQRIERLVAQGFASPQAAEQARTTTETDVSALDAAKHRAESAAADVRAARAGLVAATDRPLIDVRAPVAGKVLRIAEPNERVVAAGAPILTVGDPSRYEVVLDVLTTEAVKIRPGMTVLLDNWGGDGVLRARVRVVEPAAFTKVSALGVEEQRVNVVSDFVDGPGPLGDGYRVEGRVVVWEARDALRVPASSLFPGEGGWRAFVVEDGHARLRAVETGRRSGDDVQVLKGLQAGDRVIRRPPNDLSDGRRVAVR